MKPYLLTLSSHTEGTDRFLESLKNIDVEHIAIQFSPKTPNLKSYKAYNQPYPGNIQRFSFVPQNLDKNRYVIFTDTDDVVFQKPLPKFKYDLYLAPENLTHNQTMWKKYIEMNPIFSDLMYKEIYNAGCWAMKVETLYKLLDFQNKIGVSGIMAQCYFNLFIHHNPQLSKVIDMSIFCPMYGNLQRKMIKKENGLWKMASGKIISCIHANGFNKEFL